MNSNLSAGKEVLSYCNSCKASLAHIIEVMKGNSPGKVKCKTCGKTHAFKDPSKVNTTKTKTRRVTRKAKGKPIEELWADAIKKSKTESRTYSPKANFEQGDLIDHPSFGKGVVEKNLDGQKIYVMFETDYKTLVHNR